MVLVLDATTLGERLPDFIHQRGATHLRYSGGLESAGRA
jgi:hypothetical protein